MAEILRLGSPITALFFALGVVDCRAGHGLDPFFELNPGIICAQDARALRDERF